jgi:hypothetical protein
MHRLRKISGIVASGMVHLWVELMVSEQPVLAMSPLHVHTKCVSTCGHPRAGDYLAKDMMRTARLNNVHFEGMPRNSAAVPGAKPPFFDGMPSLRLLTWLRQQHVRSKQAALVKRHLSLCS